MDLDFFKILSEYGALGIICAYFIVRDYTIMNKQNILLTDIKGILETQLKVNEVLNETIHHERNKNLDNHEKLVGMLDGNSHLVMSQLNSLATEVKLLSLSMSDLKTSLQKVEKRNTSQ